MAERGAAERGKAPRRRGAWFVVGLGMATVAVVFVFLLLYEDRPADGLQGLDRLWAFVLGTLAAYAAGGFIAGVLVSWGFGRAGVFGWVLACAAAAVAAVLGGALGGGLTVVAQTMASGAAIPFQGLLSAAVGALILPMTVAQSPFLILLWLALVGGVHAVTGAVRHG